MIREVTAGTYCALWWPSIDRVYYDAARGDQLPLWDPTVGGYLDPTSGELPKSWEQALDEVDADEHARPFHVLSFGDQVDIHGIVGDSEESSRAVGYLCKYLTKSISSTYIDEEHPDVDYEAHISRLHAELRWLPCSEQCANWLRYGVTPKDPGPGLVPGECDSKAHTRDCLGLGGRRVLVSRHWTSKTLEEHRAGPPWCGPSSRRPASKRPTHADSRRLAAEVVHDDGQPRFVWEDVPPQHRHYSRIIAASVRQRGEWRTKYERAKELVGARPP